MAIFNCYVSSPEGTHLIHFCSNLVLGWQGGTSTGLEEHTESLVLLAVESGGWSFHSALLWHANVAVSCALGKDCRVTMIQRCPLKKHDGSKMMSIIYWHVYIYIYYT